MDHYIPGTSQIDNNQRTLTFFERRWIANSHLSETNNILLQSKSARFLSMSLSGPYYHRPLLSYLTSLETSFDIILTSPLIPYLQFILVRSERLFEEKQIRSHETSWHLGRRPLDGFGDHWKCSSPVCVFKHTHTSNK